MTSSMQTALLTTVNAPYQNCLDASALCAALKEGKIELGQVASFFTETSVEDQLEFAHEFDISSDTLAQVASAFAKWSGQDVALVA